MEGTGTHVHGDDCGHLKIKHGDHFDFLENGSLTASGTAPGSRHSLDISATNPSGCRAEGSLVCFRHHGGSDPQVPHGDHMDYLYHGRLHHPHGDHCDDHGPVEVL